MINEQDSPDLYCGVRPTADFIEPVEMKDTFFGIKKIGSQYFANGPPFFVILDDSRYLKPPPFSKNNRVC
jgi:hypothetical protein